MTLLYWVVLEMGAQRLAEVAYGARNTRRLLERGGHEVGAAQYPFFVALHAAWLAAVAILVPAQTPPSLPFLGVLVILQCLRAWVMLALGPYWTTRIITVPGAPLVRTGPFRFTRHPSYIIVSAEIVALPLTFGAVTIAVVFLALNLVLLTWRVRVEDRALDSRRAL